MNIFIYLTLLYNVLIGQKSFMGLSDFIGTVCLYRVWIIHSHVQLDTEGTWAEVPALSSAAVIVEVIVCPLLALQWLIKGLDMAFGGHSHTLCWDTGVLWTWSQLIDQINLAQGTRGQNLMFQLLVLSQRWLWHRQWQSRCVPVWQGMASIKSST